MHASLILNDHLGGVLSPRQIEQFDILYSELISANTQINLTSIVEPLEVAIKHFYDSLTIMPYLDLNSVSSMLDVGTGAGFPAMPLKILFPDLKLVLLDSLAKRVKYLHQLSAKLGFDDIEVIHGRAEDLAHNTQYREKFDLVVSRAVAKLNVLLEYCIPFAKTRGIFVAFKGQNCVVELKEAKRSLVVLGKCKVRSINEVNLPLDLGSRRLIIIDKECPTPKTYPRKAGQVTKSPIL